MLKTRIQLPALWDGQPTEWMRTLAARTQQYAEQTLLPAVCEYYEGLPSVAEKMHFEPLEYRHIWHAQPHSDTSDLLAVRIETLWMRGQRTLARTVTGITVRASDGVMVRGAEAGMRRKNLYLSVSSTPNSTACTL